MKRLIVLGADRGRLLLILLLVAASVLVGAIATTTATMEWLADRSHPQADRTYRLSARAKNSLDAEYTSLTPRRLADRLGATRAQTVTAVVPLEVGVRTSEDAPLSALRVLYVDEHFPEVFSYGVTRATLDAMTQSGGVLLTSSAAARLSVRVGQELVLVDERQPVAGILTLPPNRSHLEFDAIAPLSQLHAVENPQLAGVTVIAAPDAATYAVADASALGALKTQAEAALRDIDGYEQEVLLEPLTGLRDAPMRAGDPPTRIVQGARLQELVAASAIAILAMFGAASSLPLLFVGILERQRRVLGLLATLGDSRARLIRRFAVEVFVALAAGLMLGIILCIGLLVVGGAKGLLSDVGPAALVTALGVSGLTILLAAALTLSLAWRRLHGSIIDLLERRDPGDRPARSVLAPVALQAALAFVVIGSAALIADYLNTASHSGRAYADVWSIEMTNPDAAGALISRLQDSPIIDTVQASAWRPYGVLGSTFDVSIPGHLGKTALTSILVARGDLGDVLGQRIVSGSDLAGLPASPCRILINEILASRLSLRPEEAVGQTVQVGGILGNSDCVVQGVVANQRFSTGRAALTPVVHMLAGPTYPNYRDNYLLIRTAPGVNAEALRGLVGTGTTDNLDPVQLGSIAREAYRVESRLLQNLILSALAMLIVSVATLGSSVALSIELRTVEIGVRRALGHQWHEIMAALARPALVAMSIGAAGGALMFAVITFKWIEAYGEVVGFAPITVIVPVLCIFGAGFAALALNWFRLRRVSPAEVLRT